MNERLVQRFIHLIAVNTGLHIRAQDREALCKKLQARMKFLKFTPEEYYQLLDGADASLSKATLRDDEWRELIVLLTTGESYFFRDKGQLALLKDQTLPELIEHKRQHLQGKPPSLRLWSAGCSTGEEPYSLAILLKELIPDLDEWNILILGTDINLDSIQKAKRGIYQPWSFRMVEPKLQRRYFHQQQTGWEVDAQIRRMVTFRWGNLLKEPFPSSASGIHDMDLILCRNVFIYFDAEATSVVAEKFYNALRPGGYLMTGHTELRQENLGRLQVKALPRSVIYQRSTAQATPPAKSIASSGLPKLLQANAAPQGRPVGSATRAPSQRRPDSRQPATRQITTKSQAALRQTVAYGPQTTATATASQTEANLTVAQSLFDNGAYASAIQQAKQVLEQHSRHLPAYYLVAQASANLGEYEQATRYCQQALQVDSLTITPYYLLARIAEEQGRVKEAKDLFKKIVYLSPSAIAAYLELGSLYEREGDAARARKMRETAFELLKSLPTNAPVTEAEMTAGELLLHVKALLRNHS